MDPSVVHNILNQAMASTSSSGGGQTSTTTTFDFGKTHVVMPKGKHQATIVWLHDFGDDGYIWAQILGSFPIDNIKWVCPTAPTRSLSSFFGLPRAAWFDPKDISKDDVPPDLEGLNASAAHVADLFSREPPDVKLGIGGFSIGAATALYTATCYVLGENANRSSIQYLDNLCAVIVLSGWFPCYKTAKSQFAESNDTVLRVKSLPVFLCHGSEDDVVSYEHGLRTAYILHSSGFQNLTLRKVHGLAHHSCALVMSEMIKWLTNTMGLQGW